MRTLREQDKRASWERIFEDVRAELEKQLRLGWKDEEHNFHDWLAIVTHELGSLAFARTDRVAYVALVKVAAVAIAALVVIDARRSNVGCVS